MKKTNSIQKLSFSRETLRRLDLDALAHAAGGDEAAKTGGFTQKKTSCSCDGPVSCKILCHTTKVTTDPTFTE